jgi:hypothetical protein
MAGGFITPRRSVEARRATARDIDEEVQICTPPNLESGLACGMANSLAAGSAVSASFPKSRLV